MNKKERLELIRERVERFHGMHDSLSVINTTEEDIAEEQSLFATKAEPTPPEQKADQWENEFLKELVFGS